MTVSIRLLGWSLVAFRFVLRIFVRGGGFGISAGLLERRLAEELLLRKKNELKDGGGDFLGCGSWFSLVPRAADIAVLVVGLDICD